MLHVIVCVCVCVCVSVFACAAIGAEVLNASEDSSLARYSNIFLGASMKGQLQIVMGDALVIMRTKCGSVKPDLHALT